MSSLLHLVADRPRQRFAAGEVALEQGAPCDHLLVLLEGEVEVLRDNILVTKVSIPGALFGEMSILLHRPYTATVRATRESTCAVISRPREFLASSSEVSLYVAEQLAARLHSLNKYLIDVKQQYEGHDHIGMVDSVLETLMNRPSRAPAPMRPAAPSGP